MLNAHPDQEDKDVSCHLFVQEVHGQEGAAALTNRIELNITFYLDMVHAEVTKVIATYLSESIQLLRP